MIKIAKILLGLVALLLATAAFALYQNDVPWRDEPGFLKRLVIYTTKNTVQTSDKPVLPELRTRVYPVAAADFFDFLIPHLIYLGWEVQGVDRDNLTIDVVISSKLLRFKDDMQIRIESESKNSTRLHVHSASRLGRADYGANLSHVLALYRVIDLSL